MTKIEIYIITICSLFFLGVCIIPFAIIDGGVTGERDVTGGVSNFPVEEKTRTCEQIARQYYETHTYIEDDVFDCDNMACDVWNMLKTKGINAEIAVGNVELDEYDMEDWNHAWVIAEVAPNEWIAIECTGGYVVYDNPRYYHAGHFFNNPKSLRRFLEVWNEYYDRLDKYNEAVEYYNALVDEYNEAGFFRQLALEDDLERAKSEVYEKEKEYNNILTELNTLLEYG